jgi:hypothetical protein
MPGGGPRKGKVVVEKTKELDHFYQSRKKTKAGEASASTLRCRGLGWGERLAKRDRLVVPPSPLPSVESDAEQEEEDLLRLERQGDEQEEGGKQKDSESASDLEEEADEEEVEAEFVESNTEILKLPRKEKCFCVGMRHSPIFLMGQKLSGSYQQGRSMWFSSYFLLSILQLFSIGSSYNVQLSSST